MEIALVILLALIIVFPAWLVLGTQVKNHNQVWKAREAEADAILGKSRAYVAKHHKK